MATHSGILAWEIPWTEDPGGLILVPVYPRVMQKRFKNWKKLPFTDHLGFPGGSAGKESACNEGDLGLIPGLGRSLGEGKGYPIQYSGPENSMDCIGQGITKSQTQLSDFHSLLQDWLFLSPCSPRDSQESSPTLLHSSKASILPCLVFFIVQISHPYMTTGKIIALIIRTLLANHCFCFLICRLGRS